MTEDWIRDCTSYDRGSYEPEAHFPQLRLVLLVRIRKATWSEWLLSSAKGIKLLSEIIQLQTERHLPRSCWEPRTSVITSLQLYITLFQLGNKR